MVICVKKKIFGQLGELCHQLKTFGPDHSELFEFGGIVLLPGQSQIGQRHRIGIVIGQGDKSEADLPQIDDLVDHTLKLPLPGLLPMGSPDAAK